MEDVKGILWCYSSLTATVPTRALPSGRIHINTNFPDVINLPPELLPLPASP